MKNSEEYNQERLGKIIQLAKLGQGGEKTNAIRMVKAICKKYGLDYEELMTSGEKVSEYTLYYASVEERKLAQQVIVKYAGFTKKDPMYSNRIRKVMLFNTTKEKYIEVMNAWEVLRRLFRKEKRKAAAAVYFGFLEAHDLYYTPTAQEREEEKEDKMSKSEEEARRIGSKLAENMEQAEIHKTLAAGK